MPDQRRTSHRITGNAHLGEMRLPIDLDHQLGRVANKIDNLRTHLGLLTKMMAIEAERSD